MVRPYFEDAMLRLNRVIRKQVSTLTDISREMSDFLGQTATLDITAASDHIYIGSDLPFNHRWIEVSTANDQTSAISIDLWNGTAWTPAVDVIDETSVGGVTLSQSGILSWQIDRYNPSWIRQDRTSLMTDLSTLRIFDMFWVRLTFSANLKNTTAIKYVGHKFSSDEDLAVEYPDLGASDVMDAYSTGKTNWNDQSFAAAEYIIQDLREMGVVVSKNQVLDWSSFKKASIHKTAEIIYSAFGEGRKESRDEARKNYRQNLQIKAFNVDENKDGDLEPIETTRKQEFLTR
jgi:hypothetical protein